MKKIYILIFLFMTLIAKLSYSEEGITWDECVRIAIGNNPELMSASERVKQAKSEMGINLSSMLPQVDSEASTYCCYRLMSFSIYDFLRQG